MKTNFDWQQKLLIAALIILVVAGLYFSLFAFASVAVDVPPGQYIDRTPGVRYFLWAVGDWLLVGLLFYFLLRRAALKKHQEMRALEAQDKEKVGPPP